MKFPKYIQHFTRILFSGVLVVAMLLVSYGPTSHTPRAHAFLGNGDTVLVVGGTGTIQETLSAGFNKISSFSEYWIKYKESILDPLVWQLINVTINQLSRSIVTWINSGFQGSPAFITNLGGFLTDIADSVVGNFISGSELGFLCSPFKLDLKIALALQYSKARDFKNASQCTLTRVGFNIDNFLNGNFMAGGWDDWFKMTQNPVNNPYGMMFLAQDQLTLKIGNAKIAESKTLDWGKGFLTVKQFVDDESGGHTVNVTPGTAIESQLNNALDSGSRRLSVADEFNEILGALMSQLASQVLEGAGGLLGLTNSTAGSYGGSSYSNYFDQIDADRSASQFTTSVGNPIEDSISTEEDYLALQKKIVALVTGVEDYANDRYPTCAYTGKPPASLQSDLMKAEAEIITTTSIIQSLQDLLDDYDAVVDPNTSVATLNEIMAFYGADNLAEAEYKIMAEYNALHSSGSLHFVPDIVEIELTTIPDIEKAIQTYETAVDKACSGEDFA